MTVAELIANNLGALVHPGDSKTGPTPIPLATFRGTQSQRDRHAEEAGFVADINRLTAEAIVHLLETNGYTITPTKDLAAMQTAATAAEPQRHRRLNFHCDCGQWLFMAQVKDFNVDAPHIPAAAVKALFKTSCSTGHQALRTEPVG